MGVSRRQDKFPSKDCGRRRSPTEADRAIRQALQKRGAQRGILEGSVWGRCDEDEDGLEMPIAFSSLKQREEMDAQIPKAAQ